MLIRSGSGMDEHPRADALAMAFSTVIVVDRPLLPAKQRTEKR